MAAAPGGEAANRPRRWTVVVETVLAITAASVSHLYGQRAAHHASPTANVDAIVAYVTAAAFFILAILAGIGLSGWARDVVERRLGAPHALLVRVVLVLIAGFVALAILIALLKGPAGQVVIAGALLGVLLGIAAQQVLGNLFAGLVLLLSRGLLAGRRVRVNSGALGGSYEGVVREIGLVYVRLDNDDGTFLLPNMQVLSSALAPCPSSPGRPVAEESGEPEGAAGGVGDPP